MTNAVNANGENFAQLMGRLGESSFSTNIKQWLDKLHRSTDAVTAWSIGTDIIDVSSKKSEWRKMVAGPYTRVKLTFSDGATKYGKYLFPGNGTIEDDEDEEENWNCIWVRQKREDDL
jgi:hypothetical protein